MSSRNAKLVEMRLKTIPHPKDRKIDQLQRQMRHNFKLDCQADRRKQMDQLTASRFFWFRCQLAGPFANKSDDFFTKDLLEALVALHIERNDEEIELLKKDSQKKPQRARLLAIEEQRRFEMQTFGAKGLTAPDFCDKEVREIMLEIWDGDLKTVNCVPPVTVVRGKYGTSPKAVEALKKALSVDMLASIDDVRDQQEAAGLSNVKSQQFRREAPAVKQTEALQAKQKSVKAVSGDQVAKAGTERRMLQSKKRQQLARHVALSRSRGLM